MNKNDMVNVVIIGNTRCGKTTLINMLSNKYECNLYCSIFSDTQFTIENGRALPIKSAIDYNDKRVFLFDTQGLNEQIAISNDRMKVSNDMIIQ